MHRFAVTCVLASACMGGLFDACVRAQEISDSQYTVVAVASDIRSVVLRDPLGNVRRFGAGDMLAEGGWRLISVGADSVILRAEMQLQGRQVELRLRQGDSFDPMAMRSAIRQEGEPVYGAHRMVQEKPTSKRAKKD